MAEGQGSSDDQAVSIMLIGSGAFLLALPFVFNSSCMVVRYWSRALACNTLATFLGALAFDSLEHVIVASGLDALGDMFSEGGVLVLAFTVFLLLFALTESVIAICSGILQREVIVQSPLVHPLVTDLRAAPGAISRTLGGDLKENRERNALFFGGLIGPLTAFAAASAFGKLPSTLGWLSPDATKRCLASALLALACLAMVLDLARRLRLRLRKKGGYRVACERWHMTAIGVEDFIFSTCNSFLFFASYRLHVNKDLVGVPGELSSAVVIDQVRVHNDRAAFPAWVASTLIASTGFLAIAGSYTKKHTNMELVLPRALMVAQQTCTCCAAWAALLLSKTFVVRQGLFEDESVNARLVIAMAMTMQAFSVVAVLNSIASACRATAGMMRSVADAASLCLGFAWEECYSAAAGNVMSIGAGQLGEREAAALVSALLVALFLAMACAHRVYLVPYVEEARAGFERMQQQREKLEQSHRRQGKVAPMVVTRIV